MSRPRTRHKHLPRYVYPRHGSYHYKGKKLCRIDEGESKMYAELAKRKQLGVLDTIPAAVAAFKLAHLQALEVSTRKEHARLLDIFANEFAEFRVDQVTAVDIKRSALNLFGDRRAAARHYKARISTFFRWAITDEGLVTVNPCREVWLPKPEKKKTPWTDALWWAVRDRLSPIMQCYHDLSFLMYQRTTDIRRLLRAQNLGEVTRFAPSKTRRSSGLEVDIPNTPAILEVYERAAAIAKTMRVISPFVIPTTKGGAYTRSGINSAYRRADEQLHGKPIGLNPKALLPYACTSAKKQGHQLEQIKTGRAHTSIKTTEGYIQQHEIPVSEVRLALPKRP